MHHIPLGKLALTVLTIGLSGAGCESGGRSGDAAVGTANERGGKVIDRSQDQTINPDGSAVRTRTQVRQTPSGTTVQETQTEKREVINPGAGSQTSDPTQADPGASR